MSESSRESSLKTVIEIMFEAAEETIKANEHARSIYELNERYFEDYESTLQKCLHRRSIPWERYSSCKEMSFGLRPNFIIPDLCSITIKLMNVGQEVRNSAMTDILYTTRVHGLLAVLYFKNIPRVSVYEYDRRYIKNIGIREELLVRTSPPGIKMVSKEEYMETVNANKIKPRAHTQKYAKRHVELVKVVELRERAAKEERAKRRQQRPAKRYPRRQTAGQDSQVPSLAAGQSVSAKREPPVVTGSECGVEGAELKPGSPMCDVEDQEVSLAIPQPQASEEPMATSNGNQTSQSATDEGFEGFIQETPKDKPPSAKLTSSMLTPREPEEELSNKAEPESSGGSTWSEEDEEWNTDESTESMWEKYKALENSINPEWSKQYDLLQEQLLQDDDIPYISSRSPSEDDLEDYEDSPRNEGESPMSCQDSPQCSEGCSSDL